MITLAIAKRIILQTMKDKRTLALMMFAPLIILTMVNFLFNYDSDINLKIGYFNTYQSFNDALNDADIDLIKYSDNSSIDAKIKEDSLDAFIYMQDDTLNVTYENSLPGNTKLIEGILNSVIIKEKMSNMLATMSASKTGGINTIQNSNIVSSYIYGDEDLSYFDTINPVLIGFFVFFFVFLISGISLLKERTSKTLEKLLSAPVKRYEIILGYLIGYGFFAVFQTVIIVIYAIFALKIRFEGEISLLILTNILIALVALSLGIFLSTFANSEFQMMQFIPIIVIPQIFFTGIIPVNTMSDWLQKVAHVMPLYYGATALQDIMIKSYGFGNISTRLIILICYTAGFSILNIFGLKKYRTI